MEIGAPNKPQELLNSPARARGFRNEKEVSDFIRVSCTFQFLPVDEGLSAVEHFAIAVLNPKLNK
jgi:hypothetical protein